MTKHTISDTASVSDGKHDPKSIFDPDEVKGPDPKEWGNDKDRPAADPNTIDEDSRKAWAAGKPNKDGVKGPDPKVWGPLDKGD